MPKYHGIQNNIIYPQPDFSATQNDRGGWTASRTYALTRATWNLTTYRAKFSRGTPITVLDTTIEPYHAFLTIEAANPSYVEGDIVEVRVEFVGGQVAQYDGNTIAAEAETTYRLEGRISEAPFSEHPKWKALSEQERLTLGLFINGDVIYKSSGEDGAGFYWVDTGFILDSGEQVTSSDGISFRNLIAEGQTTYRFPSITWTETTQGTSPMTSAQLNLLGRISNPRGNPPEPTGSRNWMLIGASQEQRGELYQTSIEWELSDKEGWNSFLYS